MFDKVVEGSKLRYGALLCGLFDVILSFHFLFLGIKYRLQIHDSIHTQIYSDAAVRNWALLPAYLSIQHATGVVYGGYVLIMFPALMFGIRSGRDLYILFWMVCAIMKCILLAVAVTLLCVLYNQVYNMPVDWPFLDVSFVVILIIQIIAMHKFYLELKHSTKSKYRDSQICPNCV